MTTNTWENTYNTNTINTAILAWDYKDILNKKDEIIKDLEYKVADLKRQLSKKKFESLHPLIKDIKIPNPNKVVIVEFNDGTEEKAICHKDDVFNLETGIMICVMKKMMGGSAEYNKYMNLVMKFYECKIEDEKKAAEEAERKERKRQKEIARKQRRKERKIAEQIEIQKEAYLQALKEFENLKVQ